MAIGCEMKNHFESLKTATQEQEQRNMKNNAGSAWGPVSGRRIMFLQL